MVRLRLLALLTLLLVQASCAAGFQQAAVLPWVRGGWTFSGTDFVVRDVAGGTMPVHIGADSGRLQDVGTVTQILLALDLPFLRASMAPAVLGNNNLEFIQADLLYKHLIIDEPGRRWWLLGGLGMMILNTGVSYTVHPTNNTVIAGRNVTPADTISYTDRRDSAGAYAVVGAQVEITGWCHAYGEAMVRLSHSESQFESITMPVSSNGAALDMTTSTTNLQIDRQLQGTVQTNYNVPAFLATVGIQFNLPSYRVTRRFIRWNAGDPAMDAAPPEQEAPQPNEVAPPDAQTPDGA